MRIAILAALTGALVTSPALLAADESVFRAGDPILVAHEGHDDDDEDADRDEPTREEIRERKRDLREEKRELKERERALRVQEKLRARSSVRSRQWLGLGAGAGFANIDLPCSFGSSGECDESGHVGTYSANLTLMGPHTGVRLRGIRAQDKHDDERTPYELAAMLGSRFGYSNWYGFLGAGRIQHPDDEFVGDANGFAWEFVFAPSSSTGTGFELSFQGNAGSEVDFVLFNLGARFGRIE
jgi:hypothetical protein